MKYTTKLLLLCIVIVSLILNTESAKKKTKGRQGRRQQRQRPKKKQNCYEKLGLCLLILFILVSSINLSTHHSFIHSLHATQQYQLTTGVPTDAHERVIKKAFRKLALKYHPDKVKEDERETAEAKFKELAHCYES